MHGIWGYLTKSSKYYGSNSLMNVVGHVILRCYYLGFSAFGGFEWQLGSVPVLPL